MEHAAQAGEIFELAHGGCGVCSSVGVAVSGYWLDRRSSFGRPVGVFLRSPGGEDGSGFILAVCSGNVVFEMAGWTCAKRTRVITAHGYQNADILHESTESCGSF